MGKGKSGAVVFEVIALNANIGLNKDWKLGVFDVLLLLKLSIKSYI
ncbi:MAG: hypothetical protein ACI81T_004298 [Bacteroidia bacterium]